MNIIFICLESPYDLLVVVYTRCTRSGYMIIQAKYGYSQVDDVTDSDQFVEVSRNVLPEGLQQQLKYDSNFDHWGRISNCWLHKSQIS